MRRNALILISTLIVLLFSVFIYVTYDQMNRKTQTIAYAMADYAATNNIQFLQNKFERLFMGAQYLCDGINVIENNGSLNNRGSLQQLISNSLHDKNEISSQWVCIPASDSLFIANNDSLSFFQREIIINRSKNISKRWISFPYRDQTTQRHLITFVLPFKTDKGVEGIIGIDIDLMQIHSSLSQRQESGFGYLTMISDNREIVMHPDETRIGASIDSFPEFNKYPKVISADSIRFNNIVQSDFLDLPVLQIYTPLNLKYAQNWMISVNIPVFNYMSIPNQIRQNLVYIGSVSIVIMLFILYFALGKWQREIQKRQTVEKEKRGLELQSERRDRESMEAQLNNLKNHLNPHFLFNSLSSLYTLVGKDKVLARQFVMHLSKLYRNLLLKHKENSVTLKNEIEFTQHYLFLQKIRFGNALMYEINIPDEQLSSYLLSQSLITLVENAVKHNMGTKDDPLSVIVSLENNQLVVVNDYRPSPNFNRDRLGTGLKNLERRYELINMKLPKPEIKFDCYYAYLPLIDEAF